MTTEANKNLSGSPGRSKGNHNGKTRDKPNGNHQVKLKDQQDSHSSNHLNSNLHLKSLLHGYILNCRCEGKSEATIHHYESSLRRYLSFHESNGGSLNAQEITPEDIRNFLWYVTSEPVRWGGSSPTARKPATISTAENYYRTLRTFFAWLEREGLISDNPVTHIKKPKGPKKVIEALKPEEVKILLDQFNSKTFIDVRNKLIIMMFLDTGMRVSELININMSDVDTTRGSILVRRGKGNKQRLVRIGSKTQKALWQYTSLYRRGDSQRLFTDAGGKPIKTNAIKLMMYHVGKKAHLEGVHCHRLRHTFAISFLRAGGDVFSLQYLLGHSTLSMTQRYLQSLNADDAFKAHQRFSPMDNFK